MTRLPIDTPDDLGHYADLRNGGLVRLPRFSWGGVPSGLRCRADCGGGVVSDLHTQARDEAARLRAAGDDGAADLVDALREENERLREALASIQSHTRKCHDYDDDMGHPPRAFDEGDVRFLQQVAFAALTPHGAVTPETKKAD